MNRHTTIGQFTIEHDCPSVGADIEPLVSGKVSSEGGKVIDFSGYAIEFVNNNAHPTWRSGKIGLAPNGAFQTQLRVTKDKVNTFQFELTDPQGVLQLTVPDRHIYSDGVSLLRPPAPGRPRQMSTINVSPASASELPNLIAALKAKNCTSKQRELIILGIGSLGSTGMPAFETLISFLLDDSSGVRNATFTALEKLSVTWRLHPAIDSQLASFAERLSADGKQGSAEGNAATETFAVIGEENPNVFEVLTRTIKSVKGAAQLNAIITLSKLGKSNCKAEVKASATFLIQFLREAPREVAGAIVAALHALQPPWPESPEISEVALEILAQIENDDRQVRTRAVTILSILGQYGSAIVERLVSLLDHPNEAVVLSALECLQNLGSHAQIGGAKLASLIARPSSEISAAALKVLIAREPKWFQADYAKQLVAPLATQIKKRLFRRDKWAEETLALIDISVLKSLQFRRKVVLSGLSVSCLAVLFAGSAIVWNLHTSNPAYQYELGMTLLKESAGNNPNAVIALQRSAKGHYSDAAFELGKLYEAGTLVESNTDTAIRFYQQAANEHGTNVSWLPEAQYRLASLLLAHDRLSQTTNDATDLYLAAAEQGYVESQYALGVLYQESQIWPKAIDWLSKAALQNHVAAAKRLAVLYQVGQSVPKDLLNAAKYFQIAASGGDAEAQNNLGMMYQNGQGVTQDYAQALNWFQKSSAQGNADGQFSLGSMYLDGQGVPQDYAQALAWFQKSAAQGNAKGEADLGWMYQKGYGVIQDYAQALNWYQKSAAQGNDVAQNDLGLMYQNGQGVAQDYTQALTWSQKSAAQGNADGECNLGSLYYHGNGVAQDYTKALDWFQKSAAQGNAVAQNDMGSIYYNGNGVTQDYTKALDWFQKSAVQGYAFAQNTLGLMYQNGQGVTQDYTQALAWFQKSVAQGNANGQADLGWMYQNGKGVTQDYAQALDWYRKSAAQYNAQAQNCLGVMYLNGQGVTPDYAQALNWFQKSSAQGNADGQFSLGSMYLNGQGVPQDYAQALAWFQKSAAQGNEKGQADLGWMYQYGYGVTQDYAQALDWYQKSAAQGNDVAQNNLGVMYENGSGVAADRDRAIQWYRKAADQGNADAKGALTRIQNSSQTLPITTSEPATQLATQKSIEERARAIMAPYKSKGYLVASIIDIKEGQENAIIGRQQNGEYFKATVHDWNGLDPNNLSQAIKNNLNKNVEHPLVWFINKESLKSQDFNSHYQALLDNTRLALFGNIANSVIGTLSDPSIPDNEILRDDGHVDPVKLALYNLAAQGQTITNHAEGSSDSLIVDNTKITDLRPFQISNSILSKDWQTRLNYINSLSTQQTLSQIEINDLIRALSDNDGGIRAAAVDILGNSKNQLAQQAIPALTALQNDQSPTVRNAANQALANLRDLLSNTPSTAAVRTEQGDADNDMIPGKEVAEIKTSDGEMDFELWPDVAPNTVANFMKLARSGFYDGTSFHRVIKGFMIQGGDPLTKDPSKENMWGTGGPGYTIKPEFNDHSHQFGVISMARSQDPNSAGSQFFICDGNASFLDRQYTVFGHLIKGDDVLNKIADTPVGSSNSGENSKPIQRVGVISIKIVPNK